MYLTKQKIVFCLTFLVVYARAMQGINDFLGIGKSKPPGIGTSPPTCESTCGLLRLTKKVCGSDGKNYDSGCLAMCAKVTYKPGPCCVCTKINDPVCDPKAHRTYANKCEAGCQGVANVTKGVCSQRSMPKKDVFDSILHSLEKCDLKDKSLCFQNAKDELNISGSQDISLGKFRERMTSVAKDNIGKNLVECTGNYLDCRKNAKQILEDQLGLENVTEDVLNKKIAESAGRELTNFLDKCTKTDKSSCRREGVDRLKKVLNKTDIDPVQIDRLNKESAREKMNDNLVNCMGTTYNREGKDRCLLKARESFANMTGKQEVSKVDFQKTLKKASARAVFSKVSSCQNAKMLAGETDFAKCTESSDVKNVIKSISDSNDGKLSLTKIQDRLKAGFQDEVKSSVDDCLLSSNDFKKCAKDAIQSSYKILKGSSKVQASNSEVEDLLSKASRDIASENMKQCIRSQKSKRECEKKVGNLLKQIKGRVASNTEVKEVIRAGAQNAAQDVFTACREVNSTTLMECTEKAKSALKDARGDAKTPRDEEIQKLREKWAARQTKDLMVACYATVSTTTNLTLRKEQIANCKYSSEIREKLQNTLGKTEIDNAKIADTIKRGAVDEVGEKAKSCVKAAVQEGSSKDDAHLKCRMDAKSAIKKAMGRDEVKETETRELLNDATENYAIEYLKACRESESVADCKNGMKAALQQVALKSVSKDDAKQIITNAAEKEAFRAFEACNSLDGNATRCVEDSGVAFREAFGENVTKIRARQALRKGAMKTIASVVSELEPAEIKSKVTKVVGKMKTESPIDVEEETKKVVRQALVSRIKACAESNSSKADCLNEVREILQKMPSDKSDSVTERTRQILQSKPDVVTKDSIKSFLAAVDLHPNTAQSQRLLDGKASDVVANVAEACRETKSDKTECRKEIMARYKEARNISDSDSDGKSKREQIIRKGITTLLKRAHTACVDSESTDVRQCITDKVKDTLAQIRPGVKAENEIDDATAAKAYDTFEACKVGKGTNCAAEMAADIKGSNKTKRQMLYRVKIQAVISSGCSESDRDTCDSESSGALRELSNGDSTKVEATRQQIAAIKAAEAQSDCELDEKSFSQSGRNCIEEGKKRYQENGGFGVEQVIGDINKMAKSRTDGKKLEVAEKESLDIVVKYGTACGNATIKTIKDAVGKAAQEASDFDEAIEIAKANATACQLKLRLPLKKEMEGKGYNFDEGAKNISLRVAEHLRSTTKLRRYLSTTDVSSSQTTTMEESGETTTAGASTKTTAGASTKTTAGASTKTTAGASKKTSAGVATTSIGNGDTKATTTKKEVVISGTSHSFTLSCLSVLSWAIVNSL